MLQGFSGLWAKVVQLRGKWQQKHTLQALLLAILICLPGVYVAYAYCPQEVSVNGQVIGIAKNRQIVKAALATVEDAKCQTLSYQVELVDQVVLKNRFFLAPRAGADQAEMVTLLSTLNYAAQGIAIQVNGETQVVVADPNAATQVLDKLKESFITVAGSEETIKTVTFIEEINCVPVWAVPGEILSAEAAVTHILDGEEADANYIVKKGDSLWSIAREHDLRVADLMEANPELTSEALALDQVLRLNRSKPLVTVMVTSEKTAQEAIPFPVETQESKDKPRGYRQVIQAGVPGAREVTYHLVRHNNQVVTQEVLQENILEEPVKQVVLQGTQVTVASRGLKESSSEGSGRLSWPLRGGITSSYGTRGSGFHRGIDINGNTGDPIRAAGDGKVIEAGWSGGYGKLIAIKHSGGIVTRYAHCSTLNVKPGERVARGEVIGRVGNTGHSTGSHLHFEVLINGKTVNPTKYLR
mgnify:CR=1 FL=1